MEKIFKYVFKQIFKKILKKKMAQDSLFPGSWAMVESTLSSQSVPVHVTHKDSWQFPPRIWTFWSFFSPHGISSFNGLLKRQVKFLNNVTLEIDLVCFSQQCLGSDTDLSVSKDSCSDSESLSLLLLLLTDSHSAPPLVEMIH